MSDFDDLVAVATRDGKKVNLGQDKSQVVFFFNGPKVGLLSESQAHLRFVISGRRFVATEIFERKVSRLVEIRDRSINLATRWVKAFPCLEIYSSCLFFLPPFSSVWRRANYIVEFK